MRALNSSRSKGFVEVVVGARVEAGDPVLDGAERGQQQRPGDHRAGAQPDDQVQSVEGGQE